MTTTEKATGPVLLFPGQGGYDGAALSLAYEEHPQVRAVFESMDAVTSELFSRRISDVLFRSGPVELHQLLEDETWVSQLAVYGAGLAAHRRLTDHGVRPSAVVGHSLGEITALVAAGAYTVEDGARIVARRTSIVAEGGLTGGSMVALAVSPGRAAHLVGLVEDPLLAIAVENHDKQTVLSGPREAITQVRVISGQLKTGVADVDSPFAFHNPSLAAVAPKFAEFVRRFPQRTLTVPVYSPVLQRFYAPDEQLADPLAEHLTRPVKFSSAIRALYESGERTFVEAGGRAALTSMVPKALRDVAGGEVVSLATFSKAREGEDTLTSTLTTLRTMGMASAYGVETLRPYLTPEFSDEEFADFWAAAGREVLELVSRRASAFRGARDAGGAAASDAGEPTAAVPQASPVPPEPAVAAAAVPSGSELFSAVRSLYAGALEYPEDVMTPDAHLEAELGVDSVKQMELLGRASQLFGLSTRDPDFRLSDYDTLGKVVGMIEEGLRRHRLEGAAA
ncbi:acyltransferase domain-containing protein [Streptomyces sp. NPDC004647]|uniref:acyltransferase domain-containing protein n=1 Tax=Streptomyces sp. NPDC004647 TaxID=3154671 RepID=UPI0033A29BE6